MGSVGRYLDSRDLRGDSGLKIDFFFHFTNFQQFMNMRLKGFFEIRKIPEVIGIWIAANHG